MTLPRHIAIIMDGNGRWAAKRHSPRILGHRRGADAVRKTVSTCRRLGIECLTLYAFSSENWGRPGEEVGALMELLGHYLNSELQTMLQEDIRLRVIGDISRLPESVRTLLETTMERTAGNSAMTLVLALSYGARDEVLRAVRGLVDDAARGRLSAEEVTEELLTQRLDTAGLPDPDLLIRTSGEMRISNFLLWQSAYAELYFTDVLWPDFNEAELQRALDAYARRQRRFGLTGEQLQPALPGKTKESGH